MSLNRITIFCFLLISASSSRLFANLSAKTLKIPYSGYLSYTDTGIPNGPPLVLIHAFPLNKDMWRSQLDTLSKIARVITFDIRGLGSSKFKGHYTLEFIVDDLFFLLDKLKIQKAVIGGLSMGGFVALRAIERNPDRFVGLVLANTKSEPDSDKSKLGRYQALKTIREQGLSIFAESFLKASLAPSILKEKPNIFENTKRIADSNTPEGVSAAILALTSRTDTTHGLSNVHVPTLILQGELDTIIPLETAQSLNEKIKGSKLFLIPKAGHFSNLENPDAFNTHLKKFLSEIGH